MAFNYPFTNLGGDPPQGVGTLVNLSGFKASGSTFKIPAHTVTFQLGSYNTQAYSSYVYNNTAIFNYDIRIGGVTKASKTANVAGVYVGVAPDWASGWASANVAESDNINTSSVFNSSNANSRTVPITVFRTTVTKGAAEAADFRTDATTAQIAGTEYVTLDAPPTFTASAITYDTPYIYTGLTTASVTISDLSAKYGGTITDVTLTVGQQSDSRSTNGTLSVLLDTVGTFTPTITATDSRGQTRTITLDPIEVKGYTAPVVSFTAERTLQTGVEDDEGTYATVDATFKYTDVVADLVAPSVVLTDENGTQTTPSVTWYKTRSAAGVLSSPFTDWTTVAYGDTVYGLIPNVSTEFSYQVSIRPRDTKGTGTAISQTVAPAFYTIDFLAGGHGIAFGKPALDEGFECAMPATFDDALYLDLPGYNTSGTVDKTLYDTIVSLGWNSDVLVS